MSNAVRSQNPFELLGEDDDGAGVLPTPKPKAAAPAPKAAAPPATAAKKAPSAPRANGARNNNRGPRADEPGSTMEKIHEDRNQRASRPSEVGRGRGGKRGGAHSQHIGHGAASHGGFDKKSGGHADTHKRVESGWGAETGAAELADEEKGAADAKADVQAVTPGAATPIGAADVVEADDKAAADAAKAEKRERKPRQDEEEEEDNTQTYAEWAAAKAAAAIEGVSALAKRVVGDWEGEGEVLQKKGDDAFFAAKEKARIAKEKAPKKVKETLAIDGKFAAPAGSDRGASRGGRGGRGGSRGGAEGGRGSSNPRGAGRGGARGGAARGGAAPAQKKAPAADINDANAFPSLS